MSTRTPLQNEILKFVAGLPYWQQYLSAHLLGALPEIKEPDLFKNTLLYLLQDAKLTTATDPRPALNITEPASSGDAAKGDVIAGLRLKSLANVKNVNAIKQTKPLDFTANVTVVYGKNGAGKSGFIRLLNNAFYSRGDREILPNVFEPGDGKPEADFEFQQGSEPAYTLKFPTASSRPEFGQFAVFDSKSVHVHLNEKNELHIEPVEFDFFSNLAALVEKVEEQFDSLIEKRTKANEFTKRFDGESEITKSVGELIADSNLDPLRTLAQLTEEDTQSLADTEKQLSELQVDQVTKRKQELSVIRAKIVSLQQEMKKVVPLLEQAVLDQLKTDIASCQSLKTQIEASGVQQFKDDRFLGIGSAQWSAFIKAAREFSALQHADHPRVGEACPLCHQSLEQDAAALIKSYWKFLEGKLESDLRVIESRITQASSKWDRATVPSLPEDSQTATWLTESNLPLDVSLKGYLKSSGQLLLRLREIAKSRMWEELTALNVVEDAQFDSAISLIDQQITSLDTETVKTKEAALKVKATLLKHRKKLAEIFEELENHVKACSWVKQASAVRKKVSTREITNRRKELYENYLNGRYIARFHEWCTALRTPYPIDIKQRGGAGKSERQLMIRGKYAPSQVLSEGEQRAIALADFFTEVEIANIPSGLIFDDPVNSQDLDRKELIAKKIIEQAKAKQVIVFTHDLSFVYDLKNEANRNRLTYVCHWVEKTNLDAGIVHHNLEPSLERSFVDPSEAMEYLKKAQLESNPKERENIVRHGLSLLRSSYEAFIIHDILCGCLSRFDRVFKWKPLQEAYIDKNYIEKSCDKMEAISGYVEAHLHSDHTSSTPTVDVLDEEIKSYRTLREEFLEKKKTHQKQLRQAKKQPQPSPAV